MHCSQNKHRKIADIFEITIAKWRELASALSWFAGCLTFPGWHHPGEAAYLGSAVIICLPSGSTVDCFSEAPTSSFGFQISPSITSPQPSSGEIKENYRPRVGTNQWLLNERVNGGVDGWIGGFIDFLQCSPVYLFSCLWPGVLVSESINHCQISCHDVFPIFPPRVL